MSEFCKEVYCATGGGKPCGNKAVENGYCVNHLRRKEETKGSLLDKITDLEQQLADKWIPVGERLPEPDTAVLVVGLNSYLTTAMYVFVDDGPEWSGYVWAQLTGAYNPNLLDAGEYEVDDEYGYTHWQPLPTPPKEGAP